MNSSFFSSDLNKFLDWLDKQITLSIKHEIPTVMSWYCEMRLMQWGYTNSIEDAICYEIIEAFSDKSEYTVLKEYKIYWETPPEKEVLVDLLLHIPIQYISMMLSLTKT